MGLEFLETFQGFTEKNLAFWNMRFKFLQAGLDGLTPEQREMALDDSSVLAKAGQKDLLFKWLSKNIKLGFWGDFFSFFPEMRPYFGTPEFKNYLVELELPSYWSENGWPDMCRAVGEEDFVCE